MTNLNWRTSYNALHAHSFHIPIAFDQSDNSQNKNIWFCVINKTEVKYT